MTVPAASFGNSVWLKLTAQPFGSCTKRELELTILGAAVDSGLLGARAENFAEHLNIPITRAHAYLTDLALRRPAINNKEGVMALINLLKDSEVVHEEAYFSIPLHDAALRIWLERKMARLSLNSGDTLRRDHVKLTPVGLAKIIDAADGIVSPFESLKLLPSDLKDADWVKAARKSWRSSTGWKEALGLLGNTATIAQAIFPALLGM